jgi:hypothetical protein
MHSRIACQLDQYRNISNTELRSLLTICSDDNLCCSEIFGNPRASPRELDVLRLAQTKRDIQTLHAVQSNQIPPL